MGIDIHNLNFLAHAQDLGVRYERTLAIGRQALFIEPFELEDHRRLRGLPQLAEPARAAGAPRYFEPLMQQWLGAQAAESVDASSYENATHIHDMNLPWPEASAQRGAFDAVLDFGCLEHVFNFPVAWRNVVDLCKVGGHVFHSLPANNLSGHGFYQVYMLVLARKLQDIGPLPAPQQSDYAQDEWVKGPSAAGAAAAPTTRQRLVRQFAEWGLIDALRAGRERLRAVQRAGLALPAPDYQRVDVHSLIRKPR